MKAITIAGLLLGGGFASSLNVINVHVMVLYTSIGSKANFTHIRELAPVWEDHVNSKSGWPFNVTVETYETASNCLFISSHMQTRLNNKTMPNIR